MRCIRYLFGIILMASTCYSKAEPIPATLLFESAKVSKVAFSPDERYVSVVMHENDERYFSLIDIKTFEYIPVLMFEENDQLTDYSWLDAKHVYIEYKHDNNDRVLIGTLDESSKTPKLELVQLNFTGVLVSPLEQNGTLLYAKARDASSDSLILHRMSIEQLKRNEFNKDTRLEDKLINVLSYNYEPHKNIIIAGQFDSENKEVTFKFSVLGSDKWRLLFSYKASAETFTPLYLLNKNTMAVLSNQQADKVGLYKFDIARQTLGELIYQHPKLDLVHADFDLNSGDPISVTFIENGQRSQEFFGEDAGKQHQLIKNSFVGKSSVRIASSASGRFSILLVYASNDPGTLYLYDRKINKASIISELKPKLMGYKLAQTQTLHVTSDNGVEVEAYLTRPLGGDKEMLLVMPHGGPIGIRDYNAFNPESQYYASRGFSVLRVNFRGSKGFGKAFQDSGVGQFGRAIERDISTVVAKVKKEYSFKKTCAIGASYGAFSSTMLAMMHPEEYQCVVGSYGIYDLPLLFNASNMKTREENREAVTKVVGKYSDSLLNTSPVYMADKLQSPILLIAGMEDAVADVEHTQRMEYMLNHFLKPIESLYYEGTGHGHGSFHWNVQEVSYIYDFLSRTLAEPYEYNSTDVAKNKALAEDLAILADSFNFKEKFPQDTNKANYFYTLAAKLGHGRSAFNLGITSLGKNNGDEAVSRFEQSIANDFPLGHLELGKLYSKGKLVDLNQTLAYEHFSQLKEGKGAVAARVLMAEALCLGVGIPKNVDECVSLLKFSDIPKNSQGKPVFEISNSDKDLRKIVLNRLYHKGMFTKAELAKLQHILKNEYQVELKNLIVENVSLGLLNEGKIIEETTDVAYEVGTKIGVTWNVDHEFTLSGRPMVALFTQWLHQNEDGTLEFLAGDMLWGHNNEQWANRYDFDEQSPTDGQIILRIKDANNNLLLEKRFSNSLRRSSLDN